MHDITQGTHGTGHDGDLLNRFGIFLHCTDQSMADLVIGHDPALFFAHDAVLFLLADQDLLDSFKQIFLAHILAMILDRVDGGFVDHIGKVGSHGAAGRQSNFFKIDGLIHLDRFGVDLQNGDTALEVGTVNNDAAVKTAGTQKGLIQDLGTVGRADDQDTLGCLESVHLGKQLVQGLLTLLIASAVTGITAAADGVNFVDKNNAGCILISFFKKVSYTGRAHTDIEFDEIRTRQREKRYMRLACNGLGQKGLAGSGRPDQQSALGEPGTDLDIAAGIVQEINDLHK